MPVIYIQRHHMFKNRLVQLAFTMALLMQISGFWVVVQMSNISTCGLGELRISSLDTPRVSSSGRARN